MRFMLCVLMLMTACVTEDPGPTGTWMFEGTAGSGDCTTVGSTVHNQFTIYVDGSGGYAFDVLSPRGVTSTGVVDCDAANCNVTFAQTAQAALLTVTWSLQLDCRDITGDGDMMGQNPVCVQSIDGVHGTLQ